MAKGNWDKLDQLATRRVEHEGNVWNIDCKMIGDRLKIYRVHGDINRMGDLLDGIALELAARELNLMIEQEPH